MKELSKRQREVMALTVAGHKQTVIAGALRISVRTVRFHLARALKKCGSDNKVTAAFFLGRNAVARGSILKSQLTLKL